MASVWRLNLELVVALVMHTIQATTTSTPITCKTGYCRVGDETFVTCNFHKNINVSKPGISVIHYPLHSSDTDKEIDVLKCVWKDDEEKPDCIVADGYTFDSRITDHLTVKIPAATDKVAGLYICHVISKENFSPHACDLTLKADGAPTIESSTVSQQPTTPGNDKAVPQKDTEICTTALINTLCLVALIILIAIFAVLAQRLLTTRNSREPAPEAGLEGSPTPTTPLISMEMEMTRMHQGSDTSPLHRDYGIQTSRETDSLEVQTDFSSSETIERVEDIPPFSVYKPKLPAEGVRQRKTQQAGTQYQFSTNTKSRAAAATRKTSAGASCAQVKGNSEETVPPTNAVVKMSVQPQHSSDKYLVAMSRKGQAPSDETGNALAGSSINEEQDKRTEIETEQTRNHPNATGASDSPMTKIVTKKWVPVRMYLPSGLRKKGTWDIVPDNNSISRDDLKLWSSKSKKTQEEKNKKEEKQKEEKQNQHGGKH